MKKKLSMQELLNKFPECDTFSLAGSVNKRLTNGDLKKILKDTENGAKDFCLKYCFVASNGVDFEYTYNVIRKQFYQSYGVMGTKELVKSVVFKLIIDKFNTMDHNSSKCKEIINYINNNNFKNDSKDIAYICETLDVCKDYSQLENYILAVIQQLYLEYDCKQNAENNETQKIKLDTVLKNNLIKEEISYDDGAAIYSFLSTVYYFKLNDETKKWLLQFKSDFDFDGPFDDLVFYKNGEVVFSSVTHEKINTLDEDFYNEYHKNDNLQ